MLGRAVTQAFQYVRSAVSASTLGKLGWHLTLYKGVGHRNRNKQLNQLRCQIRVCYNLATKLASFGAWGIYGKMAQIFVDFEGNAGKTVGGDLGTEAPF